MPLPILVGAIATAIARSALTAGAKRMLTKSLLEKSISPKTINGIIRSANKGNKILNAKEIKDLMRPQGSTYRENRVGPKARVAAPESEYPRDAFFVKPDGRMIYGRFDKNGKLIATPRGKEVVSKKGEPVRKFPKTSGEKDLERKVEIANLPKPREIVPMSKELWRLIKFPGEHQRGVARINPNLLTKKQIDRMNDKTEVVVEVRGGGIYRTTKGDIYRAELQERNIETSSKIDKQEAITRKEVGQEYQAAPEKPLENTYVYYMRHPLSLVKRLDKDGKEVFVGKKVLDKDGKPILLRITADTAEGRAKKLEAWADQLNLRNITKAGKPLTGKINPDKIFIPAKRNPKAEDGMDESKFIDIADAKKLWNRHVEKLADEGMKATGGERFEYKSMPEGLPINMRPRAADLNKPSSRGGKSALEKSVEKTDALIKREEERGLPEYILKEIRKDKGVTPRIRKMILDHANRPKLAIEAPKRFQPPSEATSFEVLKKNLFQIEKQLKNSKNASPTKIKKLLEDKETIKNRLTLLEKKKQIIPAEKL